MANHFYRLRMGTYAETLFRCSKRDLQQRLLLQYNLMRLGCELARSECQSSTNAADQPVRYGFDPEDYHPTELTSWCRHKLSECRNHVCLALRSGLEHLMATGVVRDAADPDRVLP